ncbi:hypothetical protein [Bacillus salipaludis]|uniref:Uncharacterized protein n=1 Tax=Bacillus salipaludis TaxID=2547811 RepID=A0ABW8RGZ7_9BACI
MDERSVTLLQKYFVISVYVILLASGIGLLIAYVMGIKSIETSLLILCLFGIFIVLGLGTVVVKRL